MRGIPQPWEAALLALAAFRLTRLIGWDDFPPVARARAWLTRERSDGSFDRPVLAHFIGCAFCQGAWTTFAVWGAWAACQDWALLVCAPLALAAATGLIARTLDP